MELSAAALLTDAASLRGIADGSVRIVAEG
jgi:hypothetical protein